MLKRYIKNLIGIVTQNISCCSTILKTIARNKAEKKLEPEVYVLNKFISPGSICFDIGAAYGRFTLKMSQLVGDSGRIYSFEPGNYSYKVLSAIVRYYGLKNVITIKKAISDKKGITELVIPFKKNKKLGPSLAYLKSDYHNEDCVMERIQLTTLDSYCSKINIRRLDFIKCDVEGSELLVFRGAKNILQLYQPVVLCEINAEALIEKHNLIPKQIFDFFRQRDYKAFILKDKSFEEIDCFRANDNYFFIHSRASVLNKLWRDYEK